MTTVVTGATGHVGANLIRALLAQGRAVRAFVLTGEDTRPIANLDIEIVEGDVCDPDSLHAAFAGAEVVYHLAAYISLLQSEWSRLEAVNVCGVQNVIAACRDCGVRRLVHFSSIHAHTQEPLEAPLDEARPLVTDLGYPPYDRSKAAGEREVRNAIAQGLGAVIVTPTGIIGPYDYQPSFFGSVLLALGEGRMPALVDSGFDWVDVRDVAAGAVCAERQAPTGAKYLLSGHWVSLQETARIVAEITGAPVPRFVAPMWLADAVAPFATAYARFSGARPLLTGASLHALRGNRSICHERAARDLGYCPRPFRETLEDTFRWFSANGYLRQPLALEGQT